ncbi:DUF3304 domain-containing protein [Variovorax dokdonensis]|uniref:DUF3304 domain-containing protein n=1 Tax=Variovorax dokdonensis TaxID=344883 RepID=A0ABT7NAE7_9BURK|nr:DUF3304 domain-containing protein [Variovorax dokdonensis]MDM0044898.1 DUF3304 domain-containing protein [Variovorax dokdonensis]
MSRSEFAALKTDKDREQEMKSHEDSAMRRPARLITTGHVRQSWRSWVQRSWVNARAVLAAIALAALATGCDSQSKDLFPDKSTIGVAVAGVTHYGTGIEVAQVSIDEFRAGLYRGWGETNAGDCCVLLPRNIPKEPVVVTVRWKTNRLNVDESLWHEARAPIHFAVAPENSSGLRVHFLPGHRVELWVTRTGTQHPNYPGPRLEGLPPAYQPLPGEQPEPAPAPSARSESASTSNK